ncbi:MAG TPA: hypothetical protein VGQ41_15755 [Pyrinomonadaceae bacterium]|nr:hypothetical protein [Pyrinomonadaceae bacterium]
MLRIIVVAALAFGFAGEMSAKEWRGLMPLRSTREDVEKLLGEPPPPPQDETRVYTLNKGRSIYFVDEGEVYIVYAEDLFEGPRQCLNTVAEGTVLMIQVTPKTKRPISDFVIDDKKFRKFDPSDPSNLGYEAYLNEEDGMIVRAFKSSVDQIVYVASALDKPQCPSYYENLEGLVHIMVCGLSLRFDEYGDIAFSDEKARLNNFAIQLQSQDGARGYILVYAGQKALFAEASTRGNRAKSYLLNVRKLPIDKVVAIDGGYRESFTVQLLIAPKESAPPIPAPTLDPSQVQIIYEKKRRSRKVKQIESSTRRTCVWSNLAGE